MSNLFLQCLIKTHKKRGGGGGWNQNYPKYKIRYMFKLYHFYNNVNWAL